MEAPALIEQAYRFVLQPTREQEPMLSSMLGASRLWFNAGLAEVEARLDARGAGAGAAGVDVPWSYKGLCSELDAGWRNVVAPWQAELPCGTYMAGFEALGAALQKHFKGKAAGRKVGFPRFKRRGRCSESVLFQRPRILDARRVELHRSLGPLRSNEPMKKLNRLLDRDPHARVLRATLSRHGDRFILSFRVRRSAKQRRARRPEAVVGVDVALKELATLSTGETWSNSRPLQASQRRLRVLQRKLDRQRRANNAGNFHPDGRAKKGARNWTTSRRQAETERLIRRLHARVADQRREQAHLLTTHLTREYGVIGVETLNVRGMQANRRLARHISDVGWGGILSQLAYKADWAGSLLVQAGRFYPSSKTCAECGAVKAKLPLSQRAFTCKACGHVADRDLNAARNLAQLALSEAQVQGRACHIASPAATEAARGATDPADHRSKRASATNRKDSLESHPTRREAVALAA